MNIKNLENKIKSILDKCNVCYSHGRIPFTYHHDYIRNVNSLFSSRADVAQASSKIKDIYGEDVYIAEMIYCSMLYMVKYFEDGSKLVMNNEFADILIDLVIYLENNRRTTDKINSVSL